MRGIRECCYNTSVMLTSIIVFVLVLSLLVLAHELGHFLTAKKAGIWVEEFGIGLPPRLFGKKIGETIYSLNAFPFGGFVRMHGEETGAEIKKPKRAFSQKSKKIRFLVVTAGVMMNFVLAILAFCIVYIFSGIPKAVDYVKVLDVGPSSPAQTAGIWAGDKISKIDNIDVTNSDQFIKLIEEKGGKKVVLTIERTENDTKSTKKITVTPRADPPANEGPLGVTITSTEIYFPPIWQRPFWGVYYGFKEAFAWGSTVLVSLGGMFGNLFQGEIPKDVSGPVGIFAVTSEAAKVGVLALINFIGIFSVNLAILNILPFPALDGGRLLFIALEALFGRRVLPKVEATIHTIGMVILLVLLVAITAGDVRRLISAGSLSGFLDSFIK